jgi:hypothetical protein
MMYLSRRKEDGMSKDITAVYVYDGDSKTLLGATFKAMDKMRLRVSNQNVRGDSFSMEASEKMKWLTTNWPVKFKIASVYLNGTSTLTVTVGATLTSLTQEFSNQAKVNEFMDLVKAFAPTKVDIDRMPCPRCGEMIAKTAKLCRYCKSELP